MQATENRNQDLGILTGDVLLFGGPYSNLHASTAMLDLAKISGTPATNRICTGDVVAYCGDPVETLHLWQNECVLVAGNCEQQLGAGAADCGCGFDDGSACDLLSKDWYPFANAALSNAERRYLATAPQTVTFTHLDRRYAVIHGGLNDVARFVWSVSPKVDFGQEISAIHALVGPIDCVVAGHSGIAFQAEIDGIEWTNTGVIGMPPNRGRPETQFGVLTDDGIKIEELSYDHAAARQSMESVGLIQGYEKALVLGYWPNEDVLPLSLRRASASASG